MRDARTRVRLYKGALRREAEERFGREATWAVRDGWYPTEWHWDGMALRVVYALGRPDRRPEPATGRRAPAFRRFVPKPVWRQTRSREEPPGRQR
jgi:hypothetical protein